MASPSRRYTAADATPITVGEPFVDGSDGPGAILHHIRLQAVKRTFAAGGKLRRIETVKGWIRKR